MKWHKILSAGAITSPDFIKLIKLGRRKICVVKSGDQFFAVQNRCPHAGGDLSQGWCKNGKLICAIHRYEYNLQTGRGAAGQGDYIDTYPLEIRDDGIYIGLTDKWTFIKNIFRL